MFVWILWRDGKGKKQVIQSDKTEDLYFKFIFFPTSDRKPKFQEIPRRLFKRQLLNAATVMIFSKPWDSFFLSFQVSFWGWDFLVDCQSSFVPCCSENIGTSLQAGRIQLELGQTAYIGTAYRLNVVVNSGRNLDLNFLKGSILSQPLALDRHHLICPTCLQSTNRYVRYWRLWENAFCWISPDYSSSEPSLPHLVFGLYSPDWKCFDLEAKSKLFECPD